MCVLFVLVHAGQQVKILGENYTLEDEEDSRIGNVSGMFVVAKPRHYF